MRHFLIYSNQIVGQVDDCNNAPSNFTCVDYEGNEPAEDLMYHPESNRVIPKPVKPDGDNWVWDGTQWVDTTPPTPPTEVVMLPDGDITPEELLSQPITRGIFEKCKTDQVLLTIVVNLIAAWLLDRSLTDGLMKQLLERYNEE